MQRLVPDTAVLERGGMESMGLWSGQEWTIRSHADICRLSTLHTIDKNISGSPGSVSMVLVLLLSIDWP
jgi:hypothetical protein